MDTREGRFLPVPHCIRDTQGWTLEPEIAAECTPDMMSFEKPTFGSTELCRYVCALAEKKNAPEGRGLTVELCRRMHGYLRRFQRAAPQSRASGSGFGR